MKKIIVRFTETSAGEIVAINGMNKKIKGEPAILKVVDSWGRNGVRMIFHPIGKNAGKDVGIYPGQPRTPGLYIFDELAREKWQKSGKNVLKKVSDYMHTVTNFSIIFQDSYGKANRSGVTWEDTDYLIFGGARDGATQELL